MTAPLRYLLAILKAIKLEKVSFSDMKSLKLFVNILTVDDKYSLLSRENLKQPIQMQLFQKQSQFYHLFLYFRNVH